MRFSHFLINRKPRFCAGPLAEKVFLSHSLFINTKKGI